MSPATLTMPFGGPSRTRLFSFNGLTAQLLAQGLQPRHPMRSIQDLLVPSDILEVIGRVDAPVRSLCTDSRRATPGSLFFALPGRRTSGAAYVEEAVERGAVGVVSEEDIWVPRKAALIRVRDARAVLARTPRAFHDQPQDALELVGIAGTSGKTVVATLLRSLLDPEPPNGLLGTIHYHLGPRTLPSYRTTPEPVDLYSMLGQMRDYGCERCILEVSSHGIDQGRVADLQFGVAAFLNLGEQHLDYHGSMETYFDTVQKVFDGRNGPPPRVAVVNADDPASERLVAALPASVRVVRFGLSTAADYTARDIVCERNGTRFTLHAGGETCPVASPLLGRFNVANALAALALAEALGLDRATLLARLAEAPTVRGRMEPIDEGQPFPVVVDYMHTLEAYREGLRTLRELTEGRLIVVYGCGGDRDRRARGPITRAVADAADLVLATADNPRSEALEEIFADMRAAVQAGDPIQFVENRRHAIHLALEAAGPGDLVLIAGKGHETYQEFTDTVMPFDDRAVARDLLRKKQRFEGGAC